MVKCTILDPARVVAHQLSERETQRSTEEVMLSLVDYWQVLRVRKEFTAKVNNLCPSMRSPEAIVNGRSD